MPATSEYYGTLTDGKTVDQITLTHPAGMMLKAIQYGGIITELHVPDKRGALTDVVLGLPALDDYLAGHPWFGAITGRVAGRITNAEFTLNGKHYSFDKNNGENLLHGGDAALDKQFWMAKMGENEDKEPWVCFSHTSPEGASGFPGELKIKVTYLLSNDHEVIMKYEATTSVDTPLSLTNHSYFNLAGDGSGTVEDHWLQIYANQYVPAKKDGTLTGVVTNVSGSPDDVREPMRAGDLLPQLRNNHGENYLIRRIEDDTRQLVPVARVEERESGRVMEVLSTESSLQFYSGVALGEKEWIGKTGSLYTPFSGFCFECQGYPDGVNQPDIQDIILKADDIYRQTTIYRFSVLA